MAEATGLRNNALPYPVYGAPFGIVAPLTDADGDLVSGASTPDSEISKNGDTFADCTNEMVEIATNSGVYSLLLTATEMTADVVAVIMKSATAGMKTSVVTLYPRKLVTIRSGTSASAGSATSTIVLDASASAVDDFYNGMLCIATIDGNVEARIISDYVGSTQTATVVPDWNVAPDNNDTFVIKLPEGVQLNQANVTHLNSTAQTARDIGASVLLSSGTGTGQVTLTSGRVNADITHIATAAVSTTTAQLGVNAVQVSGSGTAADNAEVVFATDFATNYNTTSDKWQVNSDVTAAAIADAVWDEDATGHQTGGTFGQAIGDPGASTETLFKAIITDPAGTNIAADIIAIKAETATILADTNELQTDWANGGRLDLILDARASQSSVDTVSGNVDAILADTGTDGVVVNTFTTAGKAELQAEANDALVANNLDHLVLSAVDTSFDNTVHANSVIGHLAHDGIGTGGGYDRTTDSLEAIRNRGDGAWVTATGFSTHSAADVWAVATRLLTAGTNIVLAKGVGVTGFNDLSAVQVNAEVDTALADINLDHLIVSAVDTSFDNTVHVNSVIGHMTSDGVGTGGGFSRTTDSLEALADSGGGGPTAADIADAVWEEDLAGHSGTVGSTAEALAAAGSAGDPWGTALPGAYGAGSAGFIIGNNLNATVSSRATPAQVNTEVDAALADINLDHLLLSAVDTNFDTTVHANSVIGYLAHDGVGTGGGYDRTTDSLEAIRTRGDAAWTTAVGFSTHSAADVWAVATRVLTAGTNIVLAKGTGVTGFNDLSAAQVNAEADTALADVGLTTTVTGRIDVAVSTRATPAQVNSEVDTALADIRLDELLFADSDIDGAAPPAVGSVFHELMSKTTGSFTFDQTTDSLEAIRDRGDAAWVTATGFSTHTAADVWAVATRVLTAGTNIVLAKGTGVTGFNDLSAAQVNAEVDTALADYDGPTNAEMVARTLAAASYATAANQTTISALLDTEIADILKLLRADRIVDTSTTPWDLVLIESGTGGIGVGTELLRQELFGADGSNITSTTVVVAQAVAP